MPAGSQSLVGKVVGSYRIVTELGEGGMGTVYFAEHQKIGHRAAIKVLREEVSGNEEVVERFFHEARAVNDIRHPHIVSAMDFGHFEGRPYILMELLEGETLAERLDRLGRLDQRQGDEARSGRLEEADAIRVARSVASALGAAHERGIVHRDLKPDNIFLTNHPDLPDHVKVLDFGIAKLTDPVAPNVSLPMGRRGITAADVKLAADRETRGRGGGKPGRTGVGVVLGTPAYMSPEQCTGEAALDHRSDVYSLGVVLYESVTGRPPFVCETLEMYIVAHTSEPPTPPNELNPAISNGLSAVILRALEKRPEDRFADMRELRVALGRLRGPRRSRSGPGTTGEIAPPPPPAPAKPRPTTAALSVADEIAMAAEALRARNVVDRLTQIVRDRIEQDRLVLPTMPQSALAALEILRSDPDAPLRKVAAPIARDPLLAPKILQVANSAAHRTAVRVTTLEQAVARLGVRLLSSLLVELSAREVFRSRDPRIQAAFHGLWEHALATAVVARDLCGGAGAQAEEAYLSGLLHDVGKPVVAAFLLEVERAVLRSGEKLKMPPSMWLKVVADCHRDVGVALGRAWQLPEAVVATIEDAGHYRPGEGPGDAVHNAVAFGNAFAKRSGYPGGPCDPVAVESQVAEGVELLDLDEERLAELRERLAAAFPAASPAAPEPAPAERRPPPKQRKPGGR